jgi:hypothetical protein
MKSIALWIWLQNGYIAVPVNNCISITTYQLRIFSYDVQPTQQAARTSSLKLCGAKCSIFFEVCNKNG